MQIIIDTNALIRFFTDDDKVKADLVEKMLGYEKDLFIPDVVFPELEYILIKKYKFSRTKLAQVYKTLMSQSNIFITNETRAAINLFSSSKLDMADCIIAAYSRKGSLASFDEELLETHGIRAFWK